jgi:hypothetical protein
MSLDRAIGALVEACRRELPEYAGAAVVDLSTGSMLGHHSVAAFSAELVELLAASTVEMLQGRAVRRVDEAIHAHRGEPVDEHAFQEVLVRSAAVVHLFLRSHSRPDLAVVLVCTRSVKVGLLLVRAQEVLRDFDAALDAVPSGRR